MEREFIRWLGDRCPSHPRLTIGIGDDAAALALSRPEIVVATDLLMDGVHFRADEHGPERIGHKALAVNLSDLAAMATRPVGAVLALALPRAGVGGASPRDVAAGVVEGMLPLTERFDCPLVGGDTNVGAGPLVVSVTVFGEATDRGVVCRDGAKPGDALYVTGPLGGSIAGRHLDFTPRVEEALALHERHDLHAMIDLTDGLALDLQRLATASGVGAVVDAASVPITEAAADAAQSSGRLALDHALTDGEDFELLIAMPPAENAIAGLIRVGEVTAEPEVRIRYGEGMVKTLEPEGYEHG